MPNRATNPNASRINGRPIAGMSIKGAKKSFGEPGYGNGSEQALDGEQGKGGKGSGNGNGGTTGYDTGNQNIRAELERQNDNSRH